MQSIIQYRSFRRNIRSQIERDRTRTETLRRAQPTYDSHIDPHGSSHDDPGAGVEKDLEKDIENGNPELSPVASASSDFSDEPENAAEEKDVEAGLNGLTTQNTVGTQLGTAMTGIDVRSRTTQEDKSLGKVFVVGYEGPNDPLNPQNWPLRTRLFATANIGAIALIVGMASSIDSAAIPQASKEFGVSKVTEALATGIFLIGFGCGGPFSGPISETVGRNPVYLGTMLLYMIFIMASGLSRSIGEQLAFRFIAGFFASTPLTTAGGSLSDLWSPLERVWAFPLFANAGFLGPILGPVLGGFIAESSLVSWRWTEWITLIMSGLVFASAALFQPETYAPTLLKWKAQHLREFTGDKRYVSQIEIREQTFVHRLLHALYRPFILFVHEPIIVLFTLYLTVIYIVLFGFLDSYTFVFGETYSLSQGITGLLFVGIGVGLFIASCWVPLIYKWAKRDLAALSAAHPDQPARLQPEFRLYFAMIGAPAIPISLFWMAWTANPSISLASPLLASVLFGYGILTIFISTYQYIIDSYEIYAASALSMVAMVRYITCGGMIQVTIPMYENLGVHWTLTVFACISLVFTPAPYLFYKFGPRIRKLSKYAFARQDDESL